MTPRPKSQGWVQTRVTSRWKLRAPPGQLSTEINSWPASRRNGWPASVGIRTQRDFRGRHYEAALIIQAVAWYLRYPLSYRDIEELFLERGVEVDHSTLNRWVLAYAPLIEKRLRQFRKPHCGSIRIDETYIKVRGEWRYLYRAVDKHGNPVDFLLTTHRDLDAAKRFFRKMLSAEPLFAPDRVGTDGAGTYPPAIAESRKEGLLRIPTEAGHPFRREAGQRSDLMSATIPR